MYSNRRPYYGLKLSIADFFREPVRYLKQSNTQESMMEKPYLEEDYPKMHLKVPDFKYKPKKRPGFFWPIASGVQGGGIANIIYGDAKCGWDIVRAPKCIREPITITMSANYFWHAEFKFVTQVTENTIGVTISQLPETEARSWDEQSYVLLFPENANGFITICGFASAHVLISQTFETVVAGMPVGLKLSGGALMPVERGQTGPATLLKSNYGEKGDSCGCVTVESSCDPCSDIFAISWDYDNSAETIAQNDSVSISVKDGLGPYDWSVSGTGFTLGLAQTSGPGNTLIADDTACGSATISVEGRCGTITGHVRSTVGQWVLEEHNTDSTDGSCSGGGFFWWLVPGCSVEKTAGKYREYCTWQKAQCDCYSGPVLAQSCTGAFDQCIPEAEWEECQYTCGNHIRATSYLRYVWEC